MALSSNITSFFFSDAVRHYWLTRESQGASSNSNAEGQGSSVRGGKHLDGFLVNIVNLLQHHGVSTDDIFTNCMVHKTGKLQLPGFYRPTKEWDLLVVRDNRLLAAIELKAQAGPSFGNNFNNRTEEAMGSALDLWTAFREGAFLGSPQPWLGYLFLLEDCPETHRPVRTFEPHFDVFGEFKDASYAKRYEVFCRKLVLERQYNSACFLMSDKNTVESRSNYTEPAKDLTGDLFLSELVSRVARQSR